MREIRDAIMAGNIGPENTPRRLNTVLTHNTLSLFTKIVSELPKPQNFNAFLSHLINNTSIKQHAIHLRDFNNTIQNYEVLRNQWPTYHPFSWIVCPQSQITGLILLFLFNVATTGLTWIWIRRLRRQGLVGLQANEPRPTETGQPAFVRLRRRRRRQTTSDATV